MSVLTLGGVPEGMVPLVLSRAAAEKDILHISTDEAQAERLIEALKFFAPELEVIYFPPWDCLPYDRVSPSSFVVSQRIDALARMLQPAKGRRLVVTTVSGLLMRVLPREELRDAAFIGEAGQKLDAEKLQTYLSGNGYLRVETVREPGEFARRGGLFDLFPPGREQPLRLDFFGTTLESIRSFDPASQRTTGTETSLKLLPVTEFSLDDASQTRFRQNYREAFGAVLQDDPLYAAVCEGRRHGGMEHWLPFFHDHLETLFDYLPEVTLTLEEQTEDAITARLATIADFYQARVEMQAIDRKVQAPAYKPVPVASLFLEADFWALHRDAREVIQFTPFFNMPTTPLVDTSYRRKPVSMFQQGQSGEVDPGLRRGDGENLEISTSGIDMGGRRGRNFVDVRTQPDVNLLDEVVAHVEELKKQGKHVLLAGYTAGSRDRLVTLLKEHGEYAVEEVEDWAAAQQSKISPAIILPVDHGFASPELAIITEADIFGERLARPQKKRRKAENFISEASALNAGDLVVHVDHGVGRYEGLETLLVGGAPHDCLRIVYADNDKLFVPVENINVLTRYGESDSAILDKLGGVAWQGRKAKVKKKLLEMAAALLKIAAERQLRKGDQMTPPEGLFEEFCARFPYPETDDQLRAIEEVLEDLHSGRPMDRLVCGDVGFGKTEVAMRAAFVAAACGQQVAVITPTTLLARQHYRNFSERFTGLPLRIAHLSRMVTAKEATASKLEMAEGRVDIVIGTHALLAKSVKFKNLGLVIVDEEQHFGVKQKERMKELRHEVHVLTLTATPIPRTLQLALAGVREMSLIATPPVDRLAVRSYVLPYDPLIVKEALMREHFRGGQSFFVVPRLEDLPKITEGLAALVPDLRFAVAHGQLSAEQLESVMTDFYGGKFDILLATNIIESGLDIPNANTIIVHRADLFGLAQLYQLRGRVGRGKLRGYAYLTYQQGRILGDHARRRLEVMGTLDSLGAGFTLASHDMDIRGGGNLLGEEQSGHIREVGVELYQHMLEEAVRDAKSGHHDEAQSEDWQPQITIGLPVLIPEAYVPDLTVRLGLYRRVADLHDRAEIDSFAAELVDRFGKLPPEVDNLLAVISIKQLCRAAHVEKLEAGPKGAVIGFHNNTHPNPAGLVAYLSRQGAAMKLRPDHKLVALRVWDNEATRLKGIQRLLKELAETAS